MTTAEETRERYYGGEWRRCRNGVVVEGTICRICGAFVRRDESHTCSYPPAAPLRRLLIAARVGVVEWQGVSYALTWDAGE